MLLSVPLFGAGWRTVFARSVVRGIPALLAALRLVRATSSPSRQPLGLVGTILLGAALLSLLVPVLQGASLGWSVWCWALLIAVPVLFTAFWRWQHRLQCRDCAPLVPLPLFRLGSCRIGLVLALLLQSAFGAFTFV